MPSDEPREKPEGNGVKETDTKTTGGPNGHAHSHTRDTRSDLLNLSPHFEVLPTKYGGRGCFSRTHVPKDTLLLRADRPVGSAVLRPFRKEVCTWCFSYLHGKKLKFGRERVYFCSQECGDSFAEYDPGLVLLASLNALELLFLKLEGDDTSDSCDVEQEWDAVAAWEKAVSSLKESQRRKFYPTVNEADYAEIRYVLGVLYTQHRMNEMSKRGARGLEKTETEKTGTEKTRTEKTGVARSEAHEEQLFHLLQSTELEKVQKYPFLARSYANIYKFIYVSCRRELLPYVTPQNIRDIIGRNLTNAFGIWSPTTQPGEDREFLGFGVYPLGSFFNHSCAPNVDKRRMGAAYEFRTNRDVWPGEELCISYGVGEEGLEERRRILSEWFFVCGCLRCEEEARHES